MKQIKKESVNTIYCGKEKDRGRCSGCIGYGVEI